jgi:hypothetical protein
MNSVDPGSLLLQLGQQSSTPAAQGAVSDQEILKLAAGPSGASGGSYTPPDLDSPQAYARAAASVLPKGSNRFTTWMENAPTAMGGEFYKLKQLFGGKLDPIEQAVIQQAQQRAPGAGTVGDVLETLPATMAAPEALGAAGLSKLATNPYALSAIQGGLQGLLTADPGQRLQQGVVGAVTGGLMHGLGNAASGLVKGLARTPEAQALIDRGVTIPPGMLGPSGAGNKIEQALTHLPMLGSKIANARNAVPAQVADLMTQDAVAPGQTLPKGLPINEAVSQLQNGYDAAYDAAVHGYGAKPAIVRVKGGDIPLSKAFQSVANTPRQGLSADERAKLGQQLQDQLQAAIDVAKRSGGMLTDHLQTLRSSLRELARNAPTAGNTGTATRAFWDDAQEKVTQALDSQLPPKSAAALKAIDANYGKFATVRDLAASVKDRTPTMNDWSNAIARNTPKPVYAAGGGWNRDLAQAASKVVKPTVTHTGALGAGTIAPIVGAVEAAAHPAWLMAHPVGALSGAAGLGGLYGAYSKAGMRALAGQSAPQKAIQGLLSQLHPDVRQALALASRSGLLGGINSGGLLQAPSQ